MYCVFCLVIVCKVMEGVVGVKLVKVDFEVKMVMVVYDLLIVMVVVIVVVFINVGYFVKVIGS